MSAMPSRNVLNGRTDMPKVMISAEDCISAGYRFILTLEPFTFGFQSINGIKCDRDIDVLEEGGVNDHPIYVGKPERQEQTLDLERGLLLRASSSLSSLARLGASKIPNNLARRVALAGISALDPQEALETGPSIGFIDVYSPSMKRIGCYSFMSFGMKSWELSGGLDATKSDIMIERISILHHGITRRPVNALPSLFTGAAEGALGLADTVADIALAPKKLISSVVTEFNDYKEKFNTEIKDSANDLKEKFENIPDEYEDFTGKEQKKKGQQEAENKKLQEEAIIEQTKKVDEAKKAFDDAKTEEEKNDALKDLKKESAELERISTAPAADVAAEITAKNNSVEDMKKKSKEDRDKVAENAENATSSVKTSVQKIIDDAANGTKQEKAIANAAAKDMIADALEDEANTKDIIARAYEQELAAAESACATAVAAKQAAAEEYKKALQSGDQAAIDAAMKKLDAATKDKQDVLAARNEAQEKADAAREAAEEASEAAYDAREAAAEANEQMLSSEDIDEEGASEEGASEEGASEESASEEGASEEGASEEGASDEDAGTEDSNVES